MGECSINARGVCRAALVVLFASLLAACANDQGGPAPLYMKGEQGAEAAPIAPAPRRDVRITVRPGQSVKRLALEYHVSERSIIAANHLTPPYKIKIGQSLMIPGAMEAGPVRQAMVPPRAAPQPPLPVSGAAPPVTMVPAPVATAPAAPPPVAAAVPVPAPAPRTPPPIRDIISLDDPPPAAPASAAPPPRAINFPEPAPGSSSSAAPPPPVAAAPQARPPGPSAAAEARAEETKQASAMHGGRFAWPVRGRVLSSYGVTSGGAHNDGLNIAAPKGAPIAAIDGGTVAYSGNELRGYGNLVLVKHSNGLISAYAHCEELLVKRGDTVHRGQVIAKVGATGGVSEPQLHFELRRGKQPVDPREFLTPAPSAAAAAASAG
jgi:murein DD-endopeptidase MepM/ murein hydrolase activator NlpD